jgi:glutamate mutase epsilon subunit
LITKIKEKLNYKPNSIAKIENMILENKLKDITNIQEEITLKEISIMREEIKKDLNNILNKFLEYLQKETPRYIIDINELFFDLDINELFFKFLNISNFRYDEKVIELLNKLKGENKEEIN